MTFPSHITVGVVGAVAAHYAFSPQVGTLEVLLVTVFFTYLLQDCDMCSFLLGPLKEHELFGHRGITHSLAWNIAGCALGAVLLGPSWLGADATTLSQLALFGFFLLLALLHLLPDAMISEKYGVSFFAPFSAKQYRLTYNPLECSPICLKAGLTTAWQLWPREMLWFCALVPAAMMKLVRLTTVTQLRPLRT